MGKLGGVVQADAEDTLAVNDVAPAMPISPSAQIAPTVTGDPGHLAGTEKTSFGDFYDLPGANIARALRFQPGTVRSLIHRALADLREVIEP